MEETPARNWGAFVLRGAVAIVFGLLIVFNPLIGLGTLIVLFGVFAFVDGLLAVVSSISRRHENPHWVALLIGGLIGVIIGIAVFVWPGVTAIVLVYVIAVWAIIYGISEIVAAIRLRKVIEGEWILATVGVLSLVFGLAIALFPGSGAVAMVFWIGAFAIVAGIMWVILGLRMRSWLKHAHPTTTVRPPMGPTV